MATTTIIPLHAGKGKTISAALRRSVDYVENPDKTDGGELVSAYECDPLTVDSEFMFSKHQYAIITGRDQGERDVIAYHIRQSFAPNEIDAATANRIGYELAMKLTHGKHAFVCSTHINTRSIHSHIIINSTSLVCSRKFRNFKGSSFVLRRISDQLCLENGLSVIAEPKFSKGKNYGKWLDGVGNTKPPTARETLQGLIDENLVIGQSFGDFLAKLKRAGCEVKFGGKHTAVRLPDGKKNIRFDSLGEGYTEDEIKARLMGTLDFTPRKTFGAGAERYDDKLDGATAVYRDVTAAQNDADAEHKATEHTAATRKTAAPSLLIDIQAKISAGKGAGYEQWAKIFNLKEAARTLIWLQENGIDTYDDLKAKASSASVRNRKLIQEIRDTETKQKDISELQKQIGVYGKTRAVFEAYRKSGWDRKFYDTHTADIILHRAAKKYFDAQNLGGKLPPIASLKQEWATLESTKRTLYKEYHALTPRHKELQTALMNANNILHGHTQPEQEWQAPKKVIDHGAR